MKTIAHIATSLFLLASSLSHAAEAPKSTEKLETQATHIVRGKVLDVTTKVEKSEIETDPGVHKDTIYTITVQVEGVSKGEEAKKGGKITVLAWQPHTREPNPPGRQGQDLIPKKGDTATFYLTGGGKEPFEVVTPNGVVVDKASSTAPAAHSKIEQGGADQPATAPESRPDASKDGKKQKPIDIQTLLKEGQASGPLPAGVVVRIHANLATSMPADVKLRSAAEARGVDFSKKLEEHWEFTADHVHRVVMEETPHKIGEKINFVYRRVESRPFDSKGLCKELLDGKALEIKAANGKGVMMLFAGTHYNVGGRAIEVLRNGDTVLYIGENCATGGYAESDAQAFAALYERLAGQARFLFKSKAEEAK